MSKDEFEIEWFPVDFDDPETGKVFCRIDMYKPNICIYHNFMSHTDIEVERKKIENGWSFVKKTYPKTCTCSVNDPD